MMVRSILVSCWHENAYESEAMWKLYGEGAGIAIRTTFKRLSESLKCEDIIYIGRIQYVDYDTTFIGERNAFTPLLHKRKSFEHEREVRAMTIDVPLGDARVGAYLKVDISSLIDNVIVAPYSQEWFVELVKAVAGQYGLQAPVSMSALAGDPIW